MTSGKIPVIIMREVEISNWKKYGLNNGLIPATINTNYNLAASPKKYPALWSNIYFIYLESIISFNDCPSIITSSNTAFPSLIFTRA